MQKAARLPPLLRNRFVFLRLLDAELAAQMLEIAIIPQPFENPLGP